MHLPIEMIRKAPIIVQPTQIRPTNIAHLEFLMTRGPTRITKGLELPFLLLLCSFGHPDFVVLSHGERDLGIVAQDRDLEEPSIDRLRQI